MGTSSLDSWESDFGTDQTPCTSAAASSLVTVLFTSEQPGVASPSFAQSSSCSLGQQGSVSNTHSHPSALSEKAVTVHLAIHIYLCCPPPPVLQCIYGPQQAMASESEEQEVFSGQRLISVHKELPAPSPC